MIVMKPHINKAVSSLMDQHPSMDKTTNVKMRSNSYNGQSESGEKYFNWVRKTQRPMEFLRGKRRWISAQKSKREANAYLMPNIKTRKSILIQRL
ncbi:unnamed protein product [Rotaria sp. Silwood2]|nr:unnamed protein product [Rotaria sp. Silwood2]CAF2562230.1 unnamed protein product [Rotaria sp. Silwood2]CAF2967451.1 unnamed protein product [Rotaria sp. Silwood2]